MIPWWAAFLLALIGGVAGAAAVLALALIGGLVARSAMRNRLKR